MNKHIAKELFIKENRSFIMGEARITSIEDYRAGRDSTEFGNNDEIHLHEADPRLMSIDAARKVVAGSFGSTESIALPEHGLTPEQAEYYRVYVDRVGLLLGQARQNKCAA